MTTFIEISAYAIVSLFAIYGVVELYLRILPCETSVEERNEP